MRRRLLKDLVVVVVTLGVVVGIAVVAYAVWTLVFYEDPRSRETPLPPPWLVEGILFDGSGEVVILCGPGFGWALHEDVERDIQDRERGYYFEHKSFGVRELLVVQRDIDGKMRLTADVRPDLVDLKECDLSEYRRYRPRG